jgi:hypothetical protein
MNDVALFGGSKLPAYLTNAFGDFDDTSSLSAGVYKSFPVISYKGKVWALNEHKTRTPLLNNEGDPRPSIGVVILKANAGISKVYYKTGYVEGVEAKPDCYSNDGVAPAADATDKQCTKCALCPHNQFGSRITESGGKGKACSDSRKLAVAPMDELTKPMLLRVPATSLKDLATYGEFLKGRGIPSHALVITKIKFDPEMAYPKMLFEAVRPVSEEQLEQIRATMQDPIIEHIIGVKSGEYVADVEEDAAPAEEVAEEPVTEKKPKAEKKAAEKPKAEKKAAQVEDAEFDDDVAPAPKAKSEVRTTTTASLVDDLDAWLND